MSHPPTSTNLKDRLSVGLSSVPVDANAPYVQHILGYVAALPNSGSQQHRLRYGDRNWLIGQYRWLVEHRAHGTSWAELRRVLQACVDEVDVLEQLELIEQAAVAVDATTFADTAREEVAAEMHENLATEDALHRRDVSAYRGVVAKCRTQIDALHRKMKLAGALAAKLTTQRSA
jgi:hypothetical protein